MVLFDWYYLLSRDGLKIKNRWSDKHNTCFFFLHLISSCTFTIINSSLGLRFILAWEIKRKRNQTTDRWSERIGHRHLGLLVNMYTSADPLTSSQSAVSLHTEHSSYNCILWIPHSGVSKPQQVQSSNSTPLVSFALVFPLACWETAAQTSESPSAHIHPHLGHGDPFRMSNGLENTVTFSYLTHLLLFLFQPLKAGAVFLFLAKVTELERNGRHVSRGNNPHLWRAQRMCTFIRTDSELKHLKDADIISNWNFMGEESMN